MQLAAQLLMVFLQGVGWVVLKVRVLVGLPPAKLACIGASELHGMLADYDFPRSVGTSQCIKCTVLMAHQAA